MTIVRTFFVGLGVFTLLVGALAIGAVKRIGAVNHVTRPADVPLTAALRGDLKVPHYIWCVAASDGLFDCTVSGMYRAFPRVRGYYRLEGGSSFVQTDEGEYVDFDGLNIELTHGRKLLLVEPPRPPGVPSDAVWGGGPQCGGFVKCRPDGAYVNCTRYDERTGSARTRRYTLEGDAGQSPMSEWPLRGLCPIREGEVWLSSSARLVEMDGGT